MKSLKKLCCTLLVSLLCLSFVTPALAASTPGFQAFTKTNLGAYEKFTDIDQSKWYGSSKQGVIKTACELNILNDMSPTKFDPEGTLRLNEAVKIACVIHVLYTGQADPPPTRYRQALGRPVSCLRRSQWDPAKRRVHQL